MQPYMTAQEANQRVSQFYQWALGLYTESQSRILPDSTTVETERGSDDEASSLVRAGEYCGPGEGAQLTNAA